MIDVPVDARLVRRCWSHNMMTFSPEYDTDTFQRVPHLNIRTSTRRWRRPSAFPKMVINIIHLVSHSWSARCSKLLINAAGHLSESIVQRGSDVYDAMYNTHDDLWMLNDARHVEFLCRAVGFFCFDKCVYTPHLGFANRCRKLSFWTEINKKDA